MIVETVPGNQVVEELKGRLFTRIRALREQASAK